MELAMIKFIKTLSDQNRIFYLLMRAYEHDLARPCNSRELIAELSNMYEVEIRKILNPTENIPIYDNQPSNNDKAEPSSTDSKLQPTSKFEHDEFAPVLGEWASSFSDDETV